MNVGILPKMGESLLLHLLRRCHYRQLGKRRMLPLGCASLTQLL